MTGRSILAARRRMSRTTCLSLTLHTVGTVGVRIGGPMRQVNLPLRPLLEEYGVEFNPAYEENQQVSCPVHPDRDPSCSVKLSENVWHCFSCGKGGAAIELVMEREGLGYYDALNRAKELADLTDGEVPDLSGLSGWAAASKRVAGTRSFVPPWRRAGAAAST